MKVSCPNCGDSTNFNNESPIQKCDSCFENFEFKTSKTKDVEFIYKKKTIFEAIVVHKSGSTQSLKDEDKGNLQFRINNWLKDDWQIQTVKMTEVPEIQLV
jgi:hypothetical protein